MKIDYSQLSTYIDCPQKFYINNIRKLRKIQYDVRDIDMKFGGCVHDGLELFYKGESKDKIFDTFKDFQDLPDEVYKTKSNGIKLLEEYMIHYADKDKQNYKVLEVEVKDSFNIEDVEYIVKLDTIIENRENIYVLEHKTTKNITYNFFDRFTPNMQVSGYAEYVRQKYGTCSGVIVNALQSGYRKNKYKGEPAGFHCSFQREIINRSASQSEDFREQVLTWCKRLSNSISNNIWGKNEGTCHKFRGCPYKELCQTSKGIKLDEQILESMYEQHDPLDYLK